MPARRLGNISYSLYLVQGLVLSVVFAVPAIRDAAQADVLAHWLAGALCAVLLLVVSALCYVHIEKAGIRLGKRWIRTRRAPRTRSVEGESDPA
jgi:peptidoglycan/LPS O-acetylase OafA/YrhL